MLSFCLLSSIEADSSSVSTGLIVGDGVLALIYIIAVVVAVVLILLTWWKHRTSSEDWIVYCKTSSFSVQLYLANLVKTF